MQKEHKNKGSAKNFIEKVAWNVTTATGSNAAIICAFCAVVLWSISGPIFHYSQTWLMVMNTTTTIITFLVVFFIQKAQNKDSLAIQLKLNELLVAHELASNKMVNVEDMTEDELKIIQKYYDRLREFDNKKVTTHSQKNSKKSPEIKKVRVQMENELVEWHKLKRQRNRHRHLRGKNSGNDKSLLAEKKFKNGKHDTQT
jgi:low affinity Fe/Cu permease